MMPSGTYYVGDLCYVMHNEWNEVVDKIDFNLDTQEVCLEGGRKIALSRTYYGDGNYPDNKGNYYAVDAGMIGCIHRDNIDMGNEENFMELGNLHYFPEPFEVTYDDGAISFGNKLIVGTNPNDHDFDVERGYF